MIKKKSKFKHFTAKKGGEDGIKKSILQYNTSQKLKYNDKWRVHLLRGVWERGRHAYAFVFATVIHRCSKTANDGSCGRYFHFDCLCGSDSI